MPDDSLTDQDLPKPQTSNPVETQQLNQQPPTQLPKKTSSLKIVLIIIGVIMGITVVLSASFFLWARNVNLTFDRITNEGANRVALPIVESNIEDYFQHLADKNYDAAYKLWSSDLKKTITKESFIETVGTKDYLSIKILTTTKSSSTAPKDEIVKITLEGDIIFTNDKKGTFEAIFVKQDGDWYINYIKQSIK